MTEEELIKAMKAYFHRCGDWPRAEALVTSTKQPAHVVKQRIDSMVDRGVIALSLNGRYRIVHPSGGGL